ncbi:hypothetical protein LCGC14_1862200 [marine sediment metagenome]|uniref:Uncharacterized protein n=1 Tax=marine sediment metagenome TaxID=412755 RepID=A0A0F9G765_9ZZZZ
MDKNYKFFLEVNKLQEQAIKIESVMNDLWNEIRKLSSQRLILGTKKGMLETKVRNMIIDHSKIDYIKVKNSNSNNV